MAKVGLAKVGFDRPHLARISVSKFWPSVCCKCVCVFVCVLCWVFVCVCLGVWVFGCLCDCVIVCCVGCLCVCPKRFHPKYTFIKKNFHPTTFSINFSKKKWGPKGGARRVRTRRWWWGGKGKNSRLGGPLVEFWLFLKAGDPQRCLFGLSACPEFCPPLPSLPPTPFGPSPHRKNTEHGQEQEVGFRRQICPRPCGGRSPKVHHRGHGNVFENPLLVPAHAHSFSDGVSSNFGASRQPESPHGHI